MSVVSCQPTEAGAERQERAAWMALSRHLAVCTHREGGRLCFVCVHLDVEHDVARAYLGVWGAASAES